MGEWHYNGLHLELSFSNRPGVRGRILLVSTSEYSGQLMHGSDERRGVVDTCSIDVEAVKAMIAKHISEAIESVYTSLEDQKRLYEETRHLNGNRWFWERYRNAALWLPANEDAARELGLFGWDPQSEHSPEWVDAECLAQIYEELCAEGESYFEKL